MTNSYPELDTPGLNVPYNFIPDSCFGSTLSGHVSSLTTLREFKMMALMNAITDKHDWHRKVFEDEISEKWKKEAIESDQSVTEAMVTWCIDELRYNAKRFDGGTGIVTAYDAGVVKSDTAVPRDLKEALKNAVRPLEDVPAPEKDWHPGSDGKVLDLVHPSLFPLVYGLSRILPDSITNLDNCLDQCGKGMTLQLEQRRTGTWDSAFSRKFQWLPCEVDISGDIPKITAYINNLHPQKHKELYGIIEKIIGCTIPLWNATLTPQKVPEVRTRIPFINIHLPDPPEQGPDESEDDHWQRYEHWVDTAETEQPEVGTFKPMKYPTILQHDGTLKDECRVDLKRDYGDRGLQIIVKLANIQLTPEKPEYEGGTWHIEGQLNEHICATAIYYYDSENIDGSSLAFRQTSNPGDVDEIPYDQNYYDKWLTVIFGCNDREAAIQYIGSVDTREGRLITFPNILQHRVQQFKLADSTRPGHRKILALFLVDPNIKVISSANIPSQRLDWWRESLEAEQTVLERLPAELKDHIFEQVEDFPVSMERAKELRLELMEERKNFTFRFEETLEAISLCEH